MSCENGTWNRAVIVSAFPKCKNAITLKILTRNDRDMKMKKNIHKQSCVVLDSMDLVIFI